MQSVHREVTEVHVVKHRSVEEDPSSDTKRYWSKEGSCHSNGQIDITDGPHEPGGGAAGKAGQPCDRGRDQTKMCFYTHDHKPLHSRGTAGVGGWKYTL